MSFLTIKKWFKITCAWCRQRWRWLVFGGLALVMYYFGRKHSKSQLIQAKLALKSYEKEKEAIEKAHNLEIQRRKEAEDRYSEAVSKIEEKYEEDKWNITRAKKEQVKAMVRKVKDKPEEIDQILEQELGIKKI